MRHDSQGLFWEETDDKTVRKIKVLQEAGYEELLPGFWCEGYLIADPDTDHTQFAKTLDHAYMEAKKVNLAKREPPDPVWLAAGYIPSQELLEEALAFNVDIFTDKELGDAAAEFYQTGKRHKLVYDIECYTNFFQVAFGSFTLGKFIDFTITLDSNTFTPNIPLIKWICENFTLVGFNNLSYDTTMLSLAMAGLNTGKLKQCSDEIIVWGDRPRDVLRRNKAKKIKADQIDIMDVAPLQASLKLYGGRVHTKRMQDLPFAPETLLTFEQIAITRWYCINDLRTTWDLYLELVKEIDLRISLGKVYGTDLRSKSDAQIAETVISREVEKMNGYRPQRTEIPPGTAYYYQRPHFLQYQSPLMNWVIDTICAAQFIVNDSGHIQLPEEIKNLKIEINQSVYKMGIGGLHSTEHKTMHVSDANHSLIDWDVTSYYPFIILNLGLFPKHLGANFLNVYKSIVDRRIAAKKNGDKVTADSLKIVINSSFGKFGNRWSVMYSPELVTQTTITGQLSLLMLIERLELAYIPVVSANTDGIVVKCPKGMESTMDAIMVQWQADTGFALEDNHYAALLSRDVNNYIAVKKDFSEAKCKGAYSKPGLSKNPTAIICSTAVTEYLTKNIPIKETIRGSTNIEDFVTVRTVKGGAVFDGKFLGKAIRWYYAQGEQPEMIYALSGNRVPKSEGAKPLMELGEGLPKDIDYLWYEREATRILADIGLATQ